jgi:hypothetical protein
MPASAGSQQPRLLEDVRRIAAAPLLASLREVLRALACAMFDNTASRQDLMPAEPKIQAFLIHLAVDRTLPAARQNLAMNALVFLYNRRLNLAGDLERKERPSQALSR